MATSAPDTQETHPTIWSRPAAGIWSLAGDRLVSIESFDVGPAVVLVPTEQILLVSAELPLPGLRRRAEALPFAIEDQIAEPLASVHVALGMETAPQRHVAGIVSHAVMEQWVARLTMADLPRAAIVPDVLALPIPPPGGWSVNMALGRAMVRTADGAGFAIAAEHFATAWKAAGEPICTGFGEPLPPALGASMADLAAAPLAARLKAPAVDLRQGVYGRPRRQVPRLVRRVVAVAAIGLLAHGLIVAGDTLALRHIATVRAGEARALATRIAPSAAVGDDVAGDIAGILPVPGARSSDFLPLLGRVLGALRPLGGGSAFRSVAFDGRADTLSVELEAADIPGLQRIAQTLEASGLGVESGAASADQGKAVGTFLIRGGAR